MRARVNDIYQYSKSNNLPLLGNANFDFWTSYVSAFNVYDRYFRDKFFSWFYWINFDGVNISDIYTDFVDAVNSHLLINNKRYSELYRVQVLANDAYDIVNNYDLTETHTNSRSESGNNISGAREDTQSGSATDGARTDSGSTSVGAQLTTEEKQIEGFNSASYNDADKTTVNAGAHTDTTSVNKGAQTNTTSSTLNKGAQTDSHSLTASENISISRKGNIGVQTPADVIGGHIELWTTFNFYKMIFDEIAKDYLLLDQAYEVESGGTITNENAIMDELRKLEAKINLTAKSSELTGLATKTDLTSLATKADLTPLAKSSELSSISLSIEALRGSAFTYTSEILNSIEGVSTNEY